jgi:cell division protein FtsI/penicillin-binding protein 2
VVVDNRLFSVNYIYKTGVRGNIYSDENDLMLSTIYIYDLYWFPSEVGDSAKFMQNVDSLISIFMQINPRISRETYDNMIKKTYREYRREYRKLLSQTKSEDKEVQTAAKNAMQELKKQFKIIKISLPLRASEWVTQEHWDNICSLFPSKTNSHGGCKVDKRLIHNNVYKNSAAATIGYLNIQQSKKFTDSIVYDKGIEGYYDHLLAEERIFYKRLYVNKVLVPLRENRKINPRNGADITTTINIDIQRITESALMDQLLSVNAAWGTAIVMEVKTGEIKAISNLTRTREGVYEETVDHATRESYEPGSTFKLITLIAALESGNVDTSTMVKCEKNNLFSLQRAFEISDNKGLYNAAKLAYPNFYDFFTAMMKMSLQKDLEIEVAKNRLCKCYVWI